MISTALSHAEELLERNRWVNIVVLDDSRNEANNKLYVSLESGPVMFDGRREKPTLSRRYYIIDEQITWVDHVFP